MKLIIAISAAALCSPLSGCGRESAKPITECTEYEAAVKSCFGRESDFASQATLLPKTEGDRERIRQMCAANVERIRRACP